MTASARDTGVSPRRSHSLRVEPGRVKLSGVEQERGATAATAPTLILADKTLRWLAEKSLDDGLAEKTLAESPAEEALAENPAEKTLADRLAEGTFAEKMSRLRQQRLQALISV